MCVPRSLPCAQSLSSAHLLCVRHVTDSQEEAMPSFTGRMPGRMSALVLGLAPWRRTRGERLCIRFAGVEHLAGRRRHCLNAALAQQRLQACSRSSQLIMHASIRHVALRMSSGHQHPQHIRSKCVDAECTCFWHITGRSICVAAVNLRSGQPRTCTSGAR